jgi:flagellar biosynthesis/type III secretory pathway M-ring protein FliF/YscJ
VNGTDVHYTYHWKFVKDFEITAEKARTLNEADVQIVKDDSWKLWLYIALGVLSFVLALLIIIIILKRRKKDEEEEDEENEGEGAREEEK